MALRHSIALRPAGLMNAFKLKIDLVYCKTRLIDELSEKV
jgi:hypothetical protein